MDGFGIGGDIGTGLAVLGQEGIAEKVFENIEVVEMRMRNMRVAVSTNEYTEWIADVAQIALIEDGNLFVEAVSLSHLLRPRRQMTFQLREYRELPLEQVVRSAFHEGSLCGLSA